MSYFINQSLNVKDGREKHIGITGCLCQVSRRLIDWFNSNVNISLGLLDPVRAGLLSGHPCQPSCCSAVSCLGRHRGQEVTTRTRWASPAPAGTWCHTRKWDSCISLCVLWPTCVQLIGVVGKVWGHLLVYFHAGWIHFHTNYNTILLAHLNIYALSILSHT